MAPASPRAGGVKGRVKDPASMRQWAAGGNRSFGFSSSAAPRAQRLPSSYGLWFFQVQAQEGGAVSQQVLFDGAGDDAVAGGIQMLIANVVRSARGSCQRLGAVKVWNPVFFEPLDQVGVHFLNRLQTRRVLPQIQIRK